MKPSSLDAKRSAGHTLLERSSSLRFPECVTPPLTTEFEARRTAAVGREPRPVSLNEPRVALTHFGSGVSAGFPSPADDYVADVFDLNRHLIIQGHEDATFVLRVEGWSMVGAGIFDGDEILVDRAITAKHGSVIVAVVNGDFTIKRLHIRAGLPVLVAENPDFADRALSEGEDLQVWGVVTRVLHKV